MIFKRLRDRRAKRDKMINATMAEVVNFLRLIKWADAETIKKRTGNSYFDTYRALYRLERLHRVQYERHDGVRFYKLTEKS